MEKEIEKYVYAVTKRCPEEKRIEIQKELKANIYDMLPDHATLNDLDNILHQIGNPIIVAAKYQPENRYVVSPVFYHDYVNTLKIIIAGFAAIGVLFAIIESFTSGAVENKLIELIAFMIGRIIENAVNFALFGFALVTIIFWLFNHPNIKPKVDRYLTNWKLKDLNAVPKNDIKDKKISRIQIWFECFFALTFLCIFAYVLIFQFESFGIYFSGTKIQMFANNVKFLFTIIPIVSIIITTLYYILYLKNGKKTLSVMIVNSIDALISITFLIIIAKEPQLFHLDFINYMADLFNATATNFSHGLSLGLNITFGIISVLMCLLLLHKWHTFYNHHQK